MVWGSGFDDQLEAEQPLIWQGSLGGSISLFFSLYLPPFVLLSQFCFVLVLEGFEGFCYLCLGLIYSNLTFVKSVFCRVVLLEFPCVLFELLV